MEVFTLQLGPIHRVKRTSRYPLREGNGLKRNIHDDRVARLPVLPRNPKAWKFARTYKIPGGGLQAQFLLYSNFAWGVNPPCNQEKDRPNDPMEQSYRVDRAILLPFLINIKLRIIILLYVFSLAGN